MEYRDINEVISSDGLRIVLLRGYPSPWGQAAKAMMEYKGLNYTKGALEAGGENAAVVAWSGTNSAPVVAWNDEAPLNRWDDILLLLERLAPDRPVVPDDQSQRARFFGIAHAICGQLGFGWNWRLDGTHTRVQDGGSPGVIGEKYGYNETDGALASQRSIEFIRYLGDILNAQAERGSEFILGDTVTALDFYWAAFSNLAAIPSPEVCPLDPAIRPFFEQASPQIREALDPVLIEHRDRILHTCFKIPMEL